MSSEADFFRHHHGRRVDRLCKQRTGCHIVTVGDDNLDAHEEFIALYEVENISAATLVHVIKDTLLRMDLSLARARG